MENLKGIKGISGKVYTKEELALIAKEYAEELKIVSFHAFTYKRYVDAKEKIKSIVERAARGNHEEWCLQKKSKGYIFGANVNDDISKGVLTNPNLLSWDELSEEMKEENRRNAKENFALLESIGYKIVDNEELVDEIASKSHDNWSRAKIAKGFVWDDVTNTNESILTHKDLLPYEVLIDLWPEDALYDQQVALGNLKTLQLSNCTLKAI
jgi:hypothetical protein